MPEATIKINDWVMATEEERQELPAKTEVTFITSQGEKFNVSFFDSKQNSLVIRKVSRNGGDQLHVRPRMSNVIEII